MKRALLALSVALLLAADNPALDAGKEEAKKLEGAWDIISGVVAGKKVPPAVLPVTQLIIKGDQLRLKLKEPGITEWTFKVDPAKKPKEIDLTPKGAKRALPCIYSLEGTELRLCMPLPPAKGEEKGLSVKRPDSFDTKGKPVLLLVAVRAKS
jgi:uncharacterized protein (TIGR03067 family)